MVEVACIEDVGATFPATATYHDSCHALRDLKLKEQPRRLLRNVQQLELREMEPAEECCGFGGTFSVKFDDISADMLDGKIEAILRTGADTVVSIDPSCLMQIRGGLSRRRLPVKAKHLAEILASRVATMSASFHERIDVALRDLTLQKSIQSATARFAEGRRDRVQEPTFGEYQELRTAANQIKQHTLDNLDYYLEQVETKVLEHGGQVIWCYDGDSAVKAILRIAREHGVRLAVKSKSMTSEEVGLNEALEKGRR